MIRPFAGLLASLALAACSAAEEAPAPAAVPVQAVTIAARSVPYVIELPGRVEAFRTAEVRARVTGIVQARSFREGSDVAAGQPLFRIDPREMQASYSQTAAALQQARATATNARAVVRRYEPLVGENAISRQEYDAALAAARAADANVAQLQQQLRGASLQLGYTTVRAPIAGRAGRAEVTEGALVSQGEGTLLTRIEQISRVYVSFAQSASEVMALRRAVAAGEIKTADGGGMPVSLTFSDGTDYPGTGTIDFQGLSVDAETGTIGLRAIFDNPQRLLLPGEFVRARIVAGNRADGIAVPQRAVSLSEDSASVFVIAKDGKAQIRPIELGEMFDGFWIVKRGLSVGDVVITSNLQKLRPGAPVQIAKTQTGRKPAAKPAAKQPARASGAK